MFLTDAVLLARQILPSSLRFASPQLPVTRICQSFTIETPASYLADYPYLTRNIADPPPENGQASAELGFNYAARTNGWVGDRIGEHLT